MILLDDLGKFSAIVDVIDKAPKINVCEMTQSRDFVG